MPEDTLTTTDATIIRFDDATEARDFLRDAIVQAISPSEIQGRRVT